MATLNDIVIQQKNSLIAAAIPPVSDLDPGELAINLIDGVIYVQSGPNAVASVLSYVVADGGEITA